MKNIEENVVIYRMKNVAVSNGSACNSAVVEPSHVLTAMGLTDDDAFASIRFSLGKFNSKKEIVNAIDIIKKQSQLNSVTHNSHLNREQI